MTRWRWLVKSPLALPHLLLFAFSRHRLVVERDVERWDNSVLIPPGYCKSPWQAVHYCLTFYDEFRSLFYYRVPLSRLFKLLLKPCPALYIVTPKIGPGLFIQHGFATIVAAHEIGADCWINQQVTIGFNGPGKAPTIGNGVSIRAGAKVLGAIRIGDGSIVGANAVVTKDVPPNCVVVGVPAYIIRRDGNVVQEPL